jgi:hypothetical protein
MCRVNNNKSLIKHSCNFRFLTDILKPQIIEISATSVLIYKIPQFKLQCTNNTRHVQGCSFCIFTIPCHCALKIWVAWLCVELTSTGNDKTLYVWNNLPWVVIGNLIDRYKVESFLKIVKDAYLLYFKPHKINTSMNFKTTFLILRHQLPI